MTTALAERPQASPTLDPKVIEQVLLGGDLSRLTPDQRVSYYHRVCETLGLNPLTRPFEYLNLNGKLTLYAKREATEQLRMIHGVSVDPKGFSREVIEGCYVVTAPASMPSGRSDVSTGVVPIDGLKGEARANAMMKAETKAKRRVTLSICGLGMLDETEIESIQPNASNASEERVTTERRLVAGNEHAKDGDPVYADVVVDKGTGEELPTPPTGYHYVTGYQLKNGWHEFRLLGYDLQGGSIKLSTKKEIGFVAEQAQAGKLPVRVKTSPKRNARGDEAYLDAIEILLPESWKPFAHEPPKADGEICGGCGVGVKRCTCAF